MKINRPAIATGSFLGASLNPIYSPDLQRTTSKHIISNIGIGIAIGIGIGFAIGIDIGIAMWFDCDCDTDTDFDCGEGGAYLYSLL